MKEEQLNVSLCLFNVLIFTGPPRIGVLPGFDSQGSALNTAFPTCIESIGSFLG